MVKKTGFVPYTIKLWRDSSAGSTMLLAHRYHLHLHGLKKLSHIIIQMVQLMEVY